MPSELSRKSKFYDNTILSSYKDCPRRYFLRHKLGWRSEGITTPLAFGLAWHSGQDVAWKHARSVSQQELPRLAMAAFLETWEEQGLPAEPSLEQLEMLGMRNPSTAHEMYISYIAHRWPVLKEAKLLAIEQPFAVPLPEIEDVWYVGRLDKVIQYNGQTLVIEHKTTSEYKKDGGFKTDYVEGWFSDSQVKGYQFGGGLFYGGNTQVWIDAALVHKTVHNAFRFIPIAHQTPLLLEWLADTREWIRKLNESNELKVWPKNENQCYHKFGRCQFLDICRTVVDPAKLDEPPPGYVEEFWQPFDILGLDRLINGPDAALSAATT